jgi:hypothetical protein
VCGGKAVVNGVEEFNEDRGWESDGDREWVARPFKFTYGLAWLEEDGGVGYAEKDLWPCGDVVLPKGGEAGEEGPMCAARCGFTIYSLVSVWVGLVRGIFAE